MTSRVLLGALLLLALGGGAWLVLGGRPAPTVQPDGDGPALPPAPTHSFPIPVERAASPREGLVSAEEEPPVANGEPLRARIRIAAADAAGKATGEQIRAALLETPGLYVRWESEAAKTAFVAATFRVPDPAYLPREAPLGVPLHVIVVTLRETGFDVRFDPPRLVIGKGP